MYQYDEFDKAFVRERVEQFRDQVQRRLDGALTETEFKPLRLQNGVYLQLHAYMLRVAIPYGTLNSAQLRTLADVAERWDRGYGHFTTRQNIQFNWPRLIDIPDILDALADVDMHAMQTSGNCVRNVTADHFAGAVDEEAEDPRKVAELLRQWSTDHPEFGRLPRKFKIAVTGCEQDRAVIRAHDIGILSRRVSGHLCHDIHVGGGLGRTPVIAQLLHEQLPHSCLLPYVEAILRVYNLAGRRDNKYKARIKILVKAMGLDAFRAEVERCYQDQVGARPAVQADAPVAAPSGYRVSSALCSAIERQFASPLWREEVADPIALARHAEANSDFKHWLRQNLHAHRHPDYAIVTVSTKAPGEPPGDVSAAQLRVLADVAEWYSHNELRISHEQNAILPHVHRNDLPALHVRLAEVGLATPNVGEIGDIIACPGMDYCSLATARSIPIAQQIARRFDELGTGALIGPMKIKISGCINACAHHHLGHIGILGLEKGGQEQYQFTFGGDHGEHMTLGERAGPAIAADEVVPAIERVIDTYLSQRSGPQESFLESCKRLGIEGYRLALQSTSNHNHENRGERCHS